MANKTAKRSTRTAGKTSISARDRKAITYTRRFMALAHGKPIDDQKAYRLVLEQRRFTAARLAKEQAENKARDIEARARTLEELERGLGALADVRDLLEQMELGKLDFFCQETLATFARATLASAGTEVEQSLCELGVLKIKQCGYFVPDLPVKPEAREAA